MISRLVKTSFRSLGVQNTSAALTQYPPSTMTSPATLDRTSLVPAKLKPAPSNLTTTTTTTKHRKMGIIYIQMACAERCIHSKEKSVQQKLWYVRGLISL
mmetsp:Transcript_8262/g.12776  ORF Transcript_8262/g.12776 Transcript_8262/m.12776 type:complete len:100 (+) Transcript_8262:48-347(+)